MTTAPGRAQHGDLSLALGEPAVTEEAVTHTDKSHGKPQCQSQPGQGDQSRLWSAEDGSTLRSHKMETKDFHRWQWGEDTTGLSWGLPWGGIWGSTVYVYICLCLCRYDLERHRSDLRDVREIWGLGIRHFEEFLTSG